MNDILKIGERSFSSRLFVGTGKFPSSEKMLEAIIASGSEMITVAMKRINMMNEATDDMLTHINRERVQLLPNTSGVRDAGEAVLAARMSREIFRTPFIKLEIHPDPRYLMPDPIETLKATEVLAAEGFVVLPYIQADPVLCKRLEEAGSAAVMPLGAPIGTNRGLLTRDMLRIIIEQSNVPVIIDAGLGAPSHAAEAMELGADAGAGQYGHSRGRRPCENGSGVRQGRGGRARGVPRRTGWHLGHGSAHFSSHFFPQ